MQLDQEALGGIGQVDLAQLLDAVEPVAQGVAVDLQALVASLTSQSASK